MDIVSQEKILSSERFGDFLLGVTVAGKIVQLAQFEPEKKTAPVDVAYGAGRPKKGEQRPKSHKKIIREVAPVTPQVSVQVPVQAETQPEELGNHAQGEQAAA